MREEIQDYNAMLEEGRHRAVCEFLATELDAGLPQAESKIWHRHPVWFLEGNPTVGYSKQKPGIRLMFWSGADFDEAALVVRGGKFKDASVFYNEVADVVIDDLRRWLEKSKTIQWDYQHIVRNRGLLKRR